MRRQGFPRWARNGCDHTTDDMVFFGFHWDLNYQPSTIAKQKQENVIV
jgi:hypothetical protein